MDIALFGGSNSVYRKGLQLGLSEKNNLSNFSLGASTSLQNLYELIRNIKSIDKFDFIVTESNVNDFHICNLVNAPLNFVLRNIDLFYKELSVLSIPVVVLLLPITTSGFKYSREINHQHLLNIKRFGFFYIDFISGYKQESTYDFYCLDNNDHVLKSIMYQLGLNIANDFENGFSRKLFSIKKSNYQKHQTAFQVYDFSDYNKKNKKNSVFNEDIVSVIKGKRLVIPERFKGCYLLGIHAWNDSDSKNNIDHCALIEISNGSKKIVKGFNAENQFQDIIEPFVIKDNTELYLSYELKPTEDSARVSPKNINSDSFNLISILLFNLDLENITTSNLVEGKNLSHLLPDLEFFRNLIEDYIQESKILTGYSLSDRDINLIRDVALLIEDADLKSALSLMKIAAKARPDGGLIKSKVNSYMKTLEAFSKE